MASSDGEKLMYWQPDIPRKFWLWVSIGLFMLFVCFLLEATIAHGQEYTPADCIDSYEHMLVVFPFTEPLSDENIEWLHSLSGRSIYLGHDLENGPPVYEKRHWNQFDMPEDARLMILIHSPAGLGWHGDWRFVMGFYHRDYPGHYWFWFNQDPMTTNEYGEGFHHTCAVEVVIGEEGDTVHG